jgi:phage shock protein PspC (stress-responsive transcriptional regulator)
MTGIGQPFFSRSLGEIAMTDTYKRLYRSRKDRMFSGLCAGLGEYIGLDPTVVRLIFALSAIFLFPMPIIVYGVMMLVVPEAPDSVPPVQVIEQ